ncbi:MAG: response regulator, partial [Acidobacteria bacterium ACB2]|nr:response regulator [Acidobacteria bacterium ACB2]
GGADVALLSAPGRRRLVAELDAAKKAVTAAREAAAETIERTSRDVRGHVAETVAAAGRPRVLLVEDDDENRSLISHMLRSRGADVVAFPTGGEAIEAASRSRFDIGLLDLGIPDMDGYEVFRRLRALPGGEDLPLGAVTAFTGDFDKERAQLEGFNEFVPKPVTLSAVDALLRRFVPRSRG